MIKTFADAATEDLFNGVNSKIARRQFPRELWSVMVKRLAAINVATTTGDLSQVTGNRFESLKHTKPGFYSIRVNDRFRITFRFENGDAYDVCCEDYH